MPYFSLRAREDTDSSDYSDDSDASIPELQTCPRLGQQAASKLTKLPSGRPDDYFFAGRDSFSPKPGPVSALKTPKPGPVSVPKTPNPGPASVVMTPKPGPAKTPLSERGTFSVLTTPKPEMTQSLLPGKGFVSLLKTPKSSPLVGAGSVSLLKTAKPIQPKISSSLESPGPSASVSDNLPWKVHSKFPPELSGTESSSSGGSSSCIGMVASVPQGSPNENADIYFNESDEEVKPKKIVLPDWHGLLFGGVERHCDEILTRPEVDTSYEDSKLAEDVALNFVTSKYDMPIFDCMRDFNTINSVSHAVKNIPKKFKSRKEQLIALLLMLDYLSCCSQEGNLLTLYEKCKDKNKRYHIESLDQSIRLLLDRLHSDRLSLEQLRSVDKFVTTCVGRIPSSLRMSYFSSPHALKRKLKVFEMEEKNQKENCVYNFTDTKTNNSKKLKTSIKSTTDKWELEDMDYNDLFLLRTPTKSGQLTSVKSPLLASTPDSARFGSTPTTSNSSSLKRDLLASNSTGERKGSSTESSVGERKGSSSESSVVRKSDPSKITHWLFQKNTPPKTNTGVTSLLSMQKEMSKEVTGVSWSAKQPSKVVPKTDGYSSDDSLPDIPDIVIPEQESSSYASWRRKVLGSKADEVHSSDSNSNKVKSHNSSTQACKSPFKANHNTWKSKYESPSKSFKAVGPSNCFSPLKR